MYKLLIKDSSVGEWYITPSEVFDFAERGKLELGIPSGLDPKEFAEEVVSFLKEALDDPEVVNYYGEAPKINYMIKGVKLYIFVAK